MLLIGFFVGLIGDFINYLWDFQEDMDMIRFFMALKDRKK